MVIKRALRFVFKDKSSSHEELCRRIGLSSLLEQRLAKILSIVFKILASDTGPESLRDLIALRRSTYNLRGTTDNTGPSKVKSTTFGLRSWRYAASNTKPDEFRKIQTYTAFKNNIKESNLMGLWVRCAGLFLINFTVFIIFIFLYTFKLSLTEHCWIFIFQYQLVFNLNLS